MVSSIQVGCHDFRSLDALAVDGCKRRDISTPCLTYLPTCRQEVARPAIRSGGFINHSDDVGDDREIMLLLIVITLSGGSSGYRRNQTWGSWVNGKAALSFLASIQG